ncbi:MAG: hypothetical protein QM724_13440 [Flavobacteriales bacterium]
MRTLRWLPGLILATVLAPGAFAQNEQDALRFSSILPGGTARSWGMGSAMGAVGADPAAASLNPAGFGLYNTSEVSFTPAFEVNDARTTHYGSGASDSDSRFHFGNFALILNSPNTNGGDWRGGTFGVSFDRQASFHGEVRAMGDANSTILTQFANQGFGTAPSGMYNAFPFGSGLAYDTYGIDPNFPDSLSYTGAILQGTPVRQQHTISTSGRLNTTSIFYANNYLDKLYVGASLGIVGTRYERTMVHKETNLDPAQDLNDLTYKEHLLTTGSGVDLKVGAIGRVNEQLRLGLSFHSPMWLQMSDAYTYSMTTNFRTPGTDGGTHYESDSPDGSYNYRIRTPWNVVASAAYVVGKHGLVSLDYGYTNFRQARLNHSNNLSDEYDFAMENAAIRDEFRSVHSLRVGTEWRSGNWYFRGGWGIWPDAYNDHDALQGTAYKRYTAGIGFRTTRVSIDLAGVYGTRDTYFFQYDPSLVAATSERLTDTRGMLTIAFRP